MDYTNRRLATVHTLRVSDFINPFKLTRHCDGDQSLAMHLLRGMPYINLELLDVLCMLWQEASPWRPARTHAGGAQTRQQRAFNTKKLTKDNLATQKHLHKSKSPRSPPSSRSPVGIVAEGSFAARHRLHDEELFQTPSSKLSPSDAALLNATPRGFDRRALATVLPHNTCPQRS